MITSFPVYVDLLKWNSERVEEREREAQRIGKGEPSLEARGVFRLKEREREARRKGEGSFLRKERGAFPQGKEEGSMNERRGVRLKRPSTRRPQVSR